ncbi:hypothetical protein QL285_019033 [Trifolium repens]|nr:hypothetical protein QL285_019033 [Trifolium repens]
MRSLENITAGATTARSASGQKDENKNKATKTEEEKRNRNTGSQQKQKTNPTTTSISPKQIRTEKQPPIHKISTSTNQLKSIKHHHYKNPPFTHHYISLYPSIETHQISPLPLPPSSTPKHLPRKRQKLVHGGGTPANYRW